MAGADAKRATRPTGAIAAIVLVVLLAPMPPRAFAEDAGKRDFPATLVVEEPQVETEIAPQIASWGAGYGHRTDLSADLSLKLAAPLSLVIHSAFTLLRPGGNGFQDAEVGLKYQFVANEDHELVVSAGLVSTLGGTGASRVGADSGTTLVPTLYLGKGAGDMPDRWDWAKPFATTLQVGVEVPIQASQAQAPAAPDVSAGSSPLAISLQGSVQYSLVYLSSNVPSLQVPQALNKLIPLVEYELEVPVGVTGAHEPIMGTINPGFLWVDGAATFGLEALIPINRASGTHPGARLQLSYSFTTPWPLAGRPPH